MFWEREKLALSENENFHVHYMQVMAGFASMGNKMLGGDGVLCPSKKRHYVSSDSSPLQLMTQTKDIKLTLLSYHYHTPYNICTLSNHIYFIMLHVNL